MANCFGGNRPFARSGHVVKNYTWWDASCTVGLPKQRNSYQSTLTCLCFGSPALRPNLVLRSFVWDCIIIYRNWSILFPLTGSCKAPIRGCWVLPWGTFLDSLLRKHSLGSSRNLSPPRRQHCVMSPKNVYVGGLFLESPENFSHPEYQNKILSLLITELFYSRILNMKKSSLYTRSLRRMHFSVFRNRWAKMTLRARKVSP